jgi:hypothetical protein
MMNDPMSRYELAKAQQREVLQAAEMDWQARWLFMTGLAW